MTNNIAAADSSKNYTEDLKNLSVISNIYSENGKDLSDLTREKDGRYKIFVGTFDGKDEAELYTKKMKAGLLQPTDIPFPSKLVSTAESHISRKTEPDLASRGQFDGYLTISNTIADLIINTKGEALSKAAGLAASSVSQAADKETARS